MTLVLQFNLDTVNSISGAGLIELVLGYHAADWPDCIKRFPVLG